MNRFFRLKIVKKLSIIVTVNSAKRGLGSRWLVLIISILFFASCKTQQVVQSNKADITIESTEEVKIKPISTQKLLRLVEENQIDYETLESKKVTVRFETPEKKQSLKATYRLKKDSMLILTANKGVLAVGKMALTPEKVDLVYYIDKKHFYGTLSELSHKYEMDLSFQLVQAFFSGDLVSYRNDPRKKEFRNFHVDVIDGKYVLSSLSERKFRKVVNDDHKMKRFFNKYDEEKLILQRIFIDPNTYLPSHIEVQDLKEGITTNLYYNAYSEIEGKSLPSELLIEFNKEGEETAKIKIKILRIEINSNPKFHFSVPSKYESKPIK